MRVPKAKKMEGMVTSSGLGEPSIYHALVVIFLEFFAWGLLTSPMITVLNQTFPDHTFLMNGLIVGIKAGVYKVHFPSPCGGISSCRGRKPSLEEEKGTEGEREKGMRKGRRMREEDCGKESFNGLKA